VDKLGTAYLPDKDIGILAKLTKNIKCRGFCGYNSKFGGVILAFARTFFERNADSAGRNN